MLRGSSSCSLGTWCAHANNEEKKWIEWNEAIVYHRHDGRMSLAMCKLLSQFEKHTKKHKIIAVTAASEAQAVAAVAVATAPTTHVSNECLWCVNVWWQWPITLACVNEVFVVVRHLFGVRVSLLLLFLSCCFAWPNNSGDVWVHEVFHLFTFVNGACFFFSCLFFEREVILRRELEMAKRSNKRKLNIHSIIFLFEKEI